jgi:DnaK suppressor protein
VTSLRDDLGEARRRLEARRVEIERLLELGEEGTAAVELDQQRLGRLSRMDALQQQAMAQNAERRRKAELGRVLAALRRIEEGDYGDCLVCGEPIAERRLKLDPAATHCVNCAGRS